MDDNTSRRDAEERVQNCSLSQHLDYFNSPQCALDVVAMFGNSDIQREMLSVCYILCSIDYCAGSRARGVKIHSDPVRGIILKQHVYEVNR